MTLYTGTVQIPAMKNAKRESIRMSTTHTSANGKKWNLPIK